MEIIITISKKIEEIKGLKIYKMKKILIALDYNPTAQKVAEAGYEFAKAMNAQIILVHVMNIPIFYSSATYSPIMGFGGYQRIDYSQSISDSLKLASLDFLDKTRNHLGDNSIKTLVKEGEGIAESLLEAANKLKVDIIVIGSHSQRWLEKILMGSVTEKVLDQTSLPLFIIPTKKES